MSNELLPNAFIGRTAAPDDAELSAALGSTRVLWDRLTAKLAADFGLTECDWHSYSPKAGWAMRVKEKKRNILYLVPCARCFRVNFVLGRKAIGKARAKGLPAAIEKLIAGGEKYPEGLGVRVNVKSARDVDAVCRLAAIKLER